MTSDAYTYEVFTPQQAPLEKEYLEMVAELEAARKDRTLRISDQWGPLDGVVALVKIAPRLVELRDRVGYLYYRLVNRSRGELPFMMDTVWRSPQRVLLCEYNNLLIALDLIGYRPMMIGPE